MTSKSLAGLIVDALVDAGIVSDNDVERAISIAKEEIDVRLSLGDHLNDSEGTTEKETMPEAAHVTLQEALSRGPPPAGNLAAPIFAHGTLEVELYTPVDRDPQRPHDRDEVYVVARGRGRFFDGAERYPVEAGSFLFVPAGRVHRFEDFSKDFAVWVFFYGPRGGES